jgi:hypothetical protein
VLWLFPFAAWLRRRRQPSEAAWAFLDGAGRLHIPLLGRAPFEPWRIGLIAGGACVCALVALRLGLRAGFATETREQLGFAFAFSYWQYLIALGAQAIAGMVVAARVRELRLAAALAAAFTAGVIATAAIAVVPSVASCVDPIALRSSQCAWYVDAGDTWFTFRLVVAEGALLAIAGGVVVLGVQALLGRRRVPQAASVPR